MIKKDGVFSIMFLLFLTKILGFVKLRVFAQLFGASHDLDIFWASFTIPDILFMVLVAGSVNAAIIPILIDVLYDKGKKPLNQLFQRLTFLFFLICTVSIFILYLFANEISALVVHNELAQKLLNFSDRVSPSDLELFVKLFKIGLLSPLFLGISGFITAYLQVRKRFFLTSLAPLFYNIAMILGSYILVLYFHMGVEAIAISAVIGSAIHLFVQLPSLFKYYKEEGTYDSLKGIFGDENVWKAFRLALPRTLGIFGEQLNTVVNTIISFTLTAGTLSAYKFAYSLHLFPINIIGSAIAQVTLPDLAKYSGKNDRVKFREILNNSIQLSLYLLFPFVAMMLVLRLPIVRLTYGTGAFDWQDTLLTAWCLALLTISILGQTITQILLRAFYALKDTWVPLIAIILSIIVNLLGSYYLTNFFSHYYDWRPILEQIWLQISHANGNAVAPVIASFFQDAFTWMSSRGDSDLAVGGLALSLSLAYFVETIFLTLLLNKVVKILSWEESLKPICLKLLNTLIMTAGMYFVFRLFDFQLDTSRTWSIIVLSIVVCTYGAISYLIGSKLFSPKEFQKAEEIGITIFKRVFKK